MSPTKMFMVGRSAAQWFGDGCLMVDATADLSCQAERSYQQRVQKVNLTPHMAHHGPHSPPHSQLRNHRGSQLGQFSFEGKAAQPHFSRVSRRFRLLGSFSRLVPFFIDNGGTARLESHGQVLLLKH